MTMFLRYILLLAAALTPGLAGAARSDWVPAEGGRVRVVLDAQTGRVAGAVEIALEPGWHTYWREPGEAGIPPVFDFSGSENVEKIEVAYPAPERLDDGSGVSLVYRDEAVFPLKVTPVLAKRPVTVRVALRFGVCNDICIPTEAEASVALPSAAPADPLAQAVLERVLPRVPTAPRPGHFDVEEVRVEGDDLLIAVRMPDSSYFDLFAEAPEGWYVGQPELIGREGALTRYRLALGGRPEGEPIAGQRFNFVAVAGGEGIEESIEVR